MLHEELAREFFDNAAFAVVLHKGVVFFGSAVGQRVEPVGIVAGTVIDGPALHAFGNAVGHVERQRLFVVNGVDQSVIGGFRQVFKHCFTVEYVFAVI